MFWIILFAYLAGALSLGLILLFVFCLMTTAARADAMWEEIVANYGT